MHSSDLALWRALYDAVFVQVDPGRFRLHLPFAPSEVELSLEGVEGTLDVEATLEAVRVEGERLCLYTDQGTLHCPEQAPRLVDAEGSLVGRATILRAFDAMVAAEERERTIALAGAAYFDGRSDDAIAALTPLAAEDDVEATAILGAIAALEGRSEGREMLDRAAEQGSPLAQALRAHHDADTLRRVLAGVALEPA